MKTEIESYYNALIDENNDPFRDPEPLRRYMDRWDGQIFIDLLTLTRDKTVLEIGVGTGRLAAKAASGCRHLTGIDISEKTVMRARENLSGFGNITLINADFRDHIFASRFDVVYSSLTFMHFSDKAEAIRKIYFLLKGGGVFVLSIDKSRDRTIVCNGREIEIFPDDLNETCGYITDTGLWITDIRETAAAHIIRSIKV